VASQYTKWTVRAAWILTLPVILTGTTLKAPRFPASETYTTELGERSFVTLCDGSKVALNTGSAIRVECSEKVRSARLLHGEASFDVKHGDTRPFQVSTGASTIQDVGTRFNVFVNGGTTTLAVTEGSVKLSPGTFDALHKGEQITLSTASGAILARTSLSDEELSRLMAWHAGLIDYYNTPLLDAVENFNRYHIEQIRIGDSALAQRRVSGEFSTGLQDDFIQGLQAGLTGPKIRVKKSTDSDGTPIIVLYSPRPH
jgi:transmembrane sensor